MRAAFVAQRKGTAQTTATQQQVETQTATAVADDLASLTAMDVASEAEVGPAPVVAEAERLFGSDIVEEIDD